MIQNKVSSSELGALMPMTNVLAGHNRQLAEITQRTSEAFERTNIEWQNGFQALDAAKALLRQELEVLQRENSELEAAQRGEVEALDARVNAQALVLSSQQQTLEGFRARNDVFVKGLDGIWENCIRLRAYATREIMSPIMIHYIGYGDANYLLQSHLNGIYNRINHGTDFSGAHREYLRVCPFNAPIEETDKILAQYPGAF